MPEPLTATPAGDDLRITIAQRERIRHAGLARGFARVGFADCQTLPHEKQLNQWLDAGMAGQMAFMRRHRALRAHPKKLLPTAKSLIAVAARYSDGRPDPPLPAGHGRVARYARGPDYHLVLRRRMEQLVVDIQQAIGHADFHYRPLVDSAPLLEREAAAAAGIGFIGKNTMLIAPELGSYTVLGELLLSLDIPPDEPMRPRCGSCDLCLRACPTGALTEAWRLDARRCIAYATIEHRAEIAPEIREKLGEWIFGCDECQLACPYNHPPLPGENATIDPELQAETTSASLERQALRNLRSGDYRRLVRGRALRRASRQMLQRNAAATPAQSPPPGTNTPSAADP